MTNINRLEKSQNGRDKFIPIAFLIVGLINALVHNYSLIPIAIGSGVVAFLYPHINKKSFGGYGKIAYLAVLGMLCFALLNSLTIPVHAQFLQSAETFFDTSFGTGIPAIALIFDVLRGIYVLYLAFSMIGIFQSIRDDENWIAAAKTPLLVVLGVTITDILTTFITS